MTTDLDSVAARLRAAPENAAPFAADAFHTRTLGRILADRAARHGRKPFVMFEGQAYSYEEFHRQSNRIANGLMAAGVCFGTHVALMMDNKPEMLLAYFALGKLGAVAVPLNTASKGEMLLYYLTQSDCVQIIADESYLDRLGEVLREAPQIKLIHTVPGEDRRPNTISWNHAVPLVSFERLLDASACDLDQEVRASDLCLLMYSSGTTGRSKGSMASHCCALTHGYAIAERLGYTADDVFYVSLPVFHGNAWYCSCIPALVVGGTIALARRFSVGRFWQDVNACGATQFNLLGAMTNFLWQREPDALERTHRVRQALVIPTPLAFYDDFRARFGIQLAALYGLTDAGIVSVSHSSDPPAKRASAGRPCPEIEIQIVDDNDFELPPNQVGEITLRGREPWIFPTGYYKMPDATLAAWRNLWFHTGDRGYLDEDGFLYFSDRKKDAIRRRGENISCFEVEQIISKMPAVSLVAAFPVTSEYAEDEVMVSLVLAEKAAASHEDVIRFCQANMPYFMVPRFVEFAAELPMTMNGKIEKYKLRARAEAQPDALWDREKAGIKVTR